MMADGNNEEDVMMQMVPTVSEEAAFATAKTATTAVVIDPYEIKSALISILSGEDIHFPCRAGELLQKLADSYPHLKLFPDTDLERVEDLLQSIADEDGVAKITLDRDILQELEVSSFTLLDPIEFEPPKDLIQQQQEIQVDDVDENASPIPRKRQRTSVDGAEAIDFHQAQVVTLAPKLSPEAIAASEALTASVEKLLSQKTARQKLWRENARDFSVPFFEICAQVSRSLCDETLARGEKCNKLHFVPLMRPQTDFKLGDCSYLNTCHHLDTCRYVHWTLEEPPAPAPPTAPKALREAKKPPPMPEPQTIDWGNGLLEGRNDRDTRFPPQYISCDLKHLDPHVLGKFEIVLADPPWDIHQNLPYGTMTDDEMKAMPIPTLQEEGGLLFLWVTGRAVDVARELLMHWGYERIEEIVWVKTNQLQRLIRTGRTGHWLNHTKEHCLVAIRRENPAPFSNLPPKLPSWAHKGIDTDVIVSEVRETSRKPDELYDMIERICPGRRKIELFGRRHNLRKGWITVGNQLDGSRLFEEDVVMRWNNRYPDRQINLSRSERL